MTAGLSSPNAWGLVADYLAAHLTQRAGLVIRDARQIGSGWETDLHMITIEYSKGGQTHSENLVLRLFRGPEMHLRASEEFRIMRRVAELGIPVPPVRMLATQDSPLGDAFIVMDHIAGPTMLAKLGGQSDSEIRALLRQMVALLVRIHSLPWRQVLVGADPPNDGFAGPLLEKMRDTAARFGLDEFEPTLRWLEQRRELGASTGMSLIHNDYHPDNILLRNGDMLVIDWGFAEASDFRMDLAWTVLLVGTMVGTEYRSAVLESYAQLSGSPLENFEYFEALKLTGRMLTIASWLDESVEIPVHKITRKAIRGDYKIHVLNPYTRLKQITGLSLPLIEAL